MAVSTCQTSTPTSSESFRRPAAPRRRHHRRRRCARRRPRRRRRPHRRRRPCARFRKARQPRARRCRRRSRCISSLSRLFVTSTARSLLAVRTRGCSLCCGVAAAPAFSSSGLGTAPSRPAVAAPVLTSRACCAFAATSGCASSLAKAVARPALAAAAPTHPPPLLVAAAPPCSASSHSMPHSTPGRTSLLRAVVVLGTAAPTGGAHAVAMRGAHWPASLQGVGAVTLVLARTATPLGVYRPAPARAHGGQLSAALVPPRAAAGAAAFLLTAAPSLSAEVAAPLRPPGCSASTAPTLPQATSPLHRTRRQRVAAAARGCQALRDRTARAAA